MIGFGAIFAIISPVTAPATDSPTNTSAPTSASAIVRAFVSTCEARLVRIHVAGATLVDRRPAGRT